MEDSYAEYQKMTDLLTGDKKKRDDIEKKIDQLNQEGDGKGKKKKAGKKKKK